MSRRLTSERRGPLASIGSGGSLMGPQPSGRARGVCSITERRNRIDARGLVLRSPNTRGHARARQWSIFRGSLELTGRECPALADDHERRPERRMGELGPTRIVHQLQHRAAQRLRPPDLRVLAGLREKTRDELDFAR